MRRQAQRATGRSPSPPVEMASARLTVSSAGSRRRTLSSRPGSRAHTRRSGQNKHRPSSTHSEVRVRPVSSRTHSPYAGRYHSLSTTFTCLYSTDPSYKPNGRVLQRPPSSRPNSRLEEGALCKSLEYFEGTSPSPSRPDSRVEDGSLWVKSWERCDGAALSSSPPDSGVGNGSASPCPGEGKTVGCGSPSLCVHRSSFSMPHRTLRRPSSSSASSTRHDPTPSDTNTRRDLTPPDTNTTSGHDHHLSPPRQSSASPSGRRPLSSRTPDSDAGQGRRRGWQEGRRPRSSLSRMMGRDTGDTGTGADVGPPPNGTADSTSSAAGRGRRKVRPFTAPPAGRRDRRHSGKEPSDSLC